jgi:hypothetical protein
VAVRSSREGPAPVTRAAFAEQHRGEKAAPAASTTAAERLKRRQRDLGILVRREGQ